MHMCMYMCMHMDVWDQADIKASVSVRYTEQISDIRSKVT